MKYFPDNRDNEDNITPPSPKKSRKDPPPMQIWTNKWVNIYFAISFKT